MARKDGKLPDPVNYGLWLLKFRPRSEKEMALALKKRGFSEEVAAETVASFVGWGYVNDEEYQRYLINKRKNNNFKGRAFLGRELKEAGIDAEAELAAMYTDEEEQERIAKLLRQWSRGGPVGENRDRFFGRLYRRGFAAGNIAAVLNDFDRGDGCTED